MKRGVSLKALEYGKVEEAAGRHGAPDGEAQRRASLPTRPARSTSSSRTSGSRASRARPRVISFESAARSATTCKRSSRSSAKATSASPSSSRTSETDSQSSCGASAAPRVRISSTTVASASVVVSPRSRPSATSCSSRRMILPLRVLGRSGVKITVFGRAIAPMCCATWRRSSSPCAVLGLFAASKRDERDDRLAGDVVLGADDRGLGHGRVGDEGGLDLGGRDAMAAHVHHVVDAAEQPEVALVVDLGAVTGEVAAVEPAPVRVCL